ncbi:MAG TPA: DNA mismatch repair endonuclease MutL [Chitinophagales bacterium]|nr:DNA mismatch repair endonuclease MutL [Chitinophagales bacterium]
MSDIIHLLPDSIANQIAAGEVIQRPASVVKELIENSIDAGASSIQLIVKNAGKTLVQIIDNGCGMSGTDARMSFEKHATSKISKTEDLFNIRTMGFRGEALASVAAIAQVELKTKLHDEDTGTLIEIEGSKITRQEPCQTTSGTSIAVKNLFYNVPARRNFLKSDNVELKNIIEEFTRTALANPQIAFKLFHNDYELYHLKSGNLKQRIVQLFGDDYAKKIVPVEEKSYSLNVYGFIGKPNFAKKSRGEQYIFVNNRFIKSSYLHHAIMQAYEEMLSKDHFPLYVIFLEIDPARIDINVQPQKYEVKFEDEKLLYTFVNLGVKHALGAYSVSPSLDFNQEQHLDSIGAFTNNNFTGSSILSQTPEQHREAKKFAPPSNFKSYDSTPQNWQQLHKTSQGNISQPNATPPNFSPTENASEITFRSSQTADKSVVQPHQLHRHYIVSQIKSGIILIDQQAAHERILYERYLRLLKNNRSTSQKQLFPQAIQFSPADAALLREILVEINNLGFEVQEFGENSFVVHAFPADVFNGNEQQVLEELLEQYKNQMQVTKFTKREKLAQALSISSSIKVGKLLSIEEMKNIIDELFACENPYHAPNGRNAIITFSLDELAKKFEGKKNG